MNESNQLSLFIPVVDRRVPTSELQRLSGMSLKILERLREGPATNAEFAAMFRPGAAWRTRVSDVRKFLEKNNETISCEIGSGGLSRYAIEQRKCK
jgi:hypothetical protein